MARNHSLKLPEQQVLAETAEELAKAEDAVAGSARKWAKERFGAKAREVLVRFDKDEGKLAVPEESDLEVRARKLQAQSMVVYLKNQEQRPFVLRVEAALHFAEAFEAVFQQFVGVVLGFQFPRVIRLKIL